MQLLHNNEADPFDRLDLVPLKIKSLQVREGYILDVFQGLVALFRKGLHFLKLECRLPPLENVWEDGLQLPFIPSPLV